MQVVQFWRTFSLLWKNKLNEITGLTAYRWHASHRLKILIFKLREYAFHENILIPVFPYYPIKIFRLIVSGKLLLTGQSFSGELTIDFSESLQTWKIIWGGGGILLPDFSYSILHALALGDGQIFIICNSILFSNDAFRGVFFYI